MFVAIVDFRVEATERVSVLAILRKYAEVSRAMPGNLSYRVFADAESETGVRLFHEWDSQAAFDAYATSRVFQDIAREVRPRMIASPESRRLHATLHEKRLD